MSINNGEFDLKNLPNLLLKMVVAHKSWKNVTKLQSERIYFECRKSTEVSNSITTIFEWQFWCIKVIFNWATFNFFPYNLKLNLWGIKKKWLELIFQSKRKINFNRVSKNVGRVDLIKKFLCVYHKNLNSSKKKNSSKKNAFKNFDLNFRYSCWTLLLFVKAR